MRSATILAPILLATSALGQFVAPAGGSSSTTRPTSTTATSTLPSGVSAAPTESVGCVLHGDHYHCEGPATGTVSGVPAAPTESTGCVLHGDHYHCEGNADGSQVEEASAESGDCVIHVGHTHGDCSAQDLACGAILLENYDMGLHIGSIFIVLVSSALGVGIPMISGWARQSNGDKVSSGDPIAFGRKAGFWASLFFVAKHFGTGIIISTAFIHLLFHGFVMFQNECIGELAYESTAAAISMAGALITFLLDYIGSRLASQRSGTVRNANASDSESGSASGENDSPSREKNARFPNTNEPVPHGHSHDCAHVDAAFAAEESWRVTLLEAGIIFHSIMIGVTLGAASGSGFTTLLIVITFHQFFEGAALGARIALLYWISKIRAIIMGICFILITPVGIAIGIGVRQSFSQNGKASLLSVGILNAISAGILLYTAFKLLAHDFVDGPLKHAPISRVVTALAAVVVGLIAMSVLGKWA